MRMRRGYLEVIVCTLTWGSVGIVRNHVTLPSSVIVFFRLGLGAAVVAGWLALRGRLSELRPRARPVLLASSGVLLVVHWVSEFEAFRRLDIAAAILVVFLGPVLASLAAPAVLGERLSPVTLGALALALGGIALISIPRISHVDRVGLVYALVSAVLFSVLLLAGKVLTEHYEPAPLVVWQLGIGALVVSPALGGASLHEISRGFWLMALLGVAYTGILGIVFFHAMRALQAQRLGVMFYLEPASAVLYAWWLLGQTPSPATFAGGGLIVAAGIAIIVSDRTLSAPAGLPDVIATGEFT